MRCRLIPLLLLVVLSVKGQRASDRALAGLLEQGNGRYEVSEARFLCSAAEKYDVMFQRIREARHYVHLEYFRVSNDSVGSALFRLLAEKSREGVDVRLLIDGYGNSRNRYPVSSSLRDSLSHLGIHVAVFDTFRFPWVNHIRHRDHRKIVVVDGETVFTGGMNVAKYYLTGSARSGPWRDMHVCLTGSVAEAYETIFVRMWEKVTGERLAEVQCVAGNQSANHGTAVVVNREPGRNRKRMCEAYQT